jgi:hypothetical protein
MMRPNERLEAHFTSHRLLLDNSFTLGFYFLCVIVYDVEVEPYKK